MNKLDVSVPPSDSENAAGRKPPSNIVSGTSAASVRAIGVQLVTFYFRAPVKAFFRMRVDYMVCMFFPPVRRSRANRQRLSRTANGPCSQPSNPDEREMVV